jgi:hypothetical protein
MTVSGIGMIKSLFVIESSSQNPQNAVLLFRLD